jgi:hypothetical protein
MIIEDVKNKFFVWFRKYEKCGWVKTGDNLRTGDYSPIITQFTTKRD